MSTVALAGALTPTNVVPAIAAPATTVTACARHGTPMYQAAAKAQMSHPRLRIRESASLPKTTIPIEWSSSEPYG